MFEFLINCMNFLYKMIEDVIGLVNEFNKTKLGYFASCIFVSLIKAVLVGEVIRLFGVYLQLRVHDLFAKEFIDKVHTVGMLAMLTLDVIKELKDYWNRK